MLTEDWSPITFIVPVIICEIIVLLIKVQHSIDYMNKWKQWEITCMYLFNYLINNFVIAILKHSWLTLVTLLKSLLFVIDNEPYTIWSCQDTSVRRGEKCAELLLHIICISASPASANVLKWWQCVSSFFSLIQPPLVLRWGQQVVMQDAHCHDHRVNIFWLHVYPSVEHHPSCWENAEGTLKHHPRLGQLEIKNIYWSQEMASFGKS